MEISSVKPPGEDPRDPNNKEIDPLGFALERAITMVRWADEHFLSFQKDRGSDPENAERELGFLGNAIEQGAMYLDRLAELILGGGSIDPNKRLPRDLNERAFERLRLIWDYKSSENAHTKDPT